MPWYFSSKGLHQDRRSSDGRKKRFFKTLDQLKIWLKLLEPSCATEAIGKIVGSMMTGFYQATGM
jgi:hypothetical protein